MQSGTLLTELFAASTDLLMLVSNTISPYFSLSSARDELCIVIPCGAVEEVCFGLFSTLLLGAVNCDAEFAEGCLACAAEFGVGSKSACFDYDVGHSDYLSFLGFGFLFVCCDYIILCNIPIVKYNFRKFLNFGNAQHK